VENDATDSLWMAMISLISVITFIPETSHTGSRGMDKLRAQDALTEGSSARALVFLNPLGPLRLLRGPNVLFPMSRAKIPSASLEHSRLP